MIDCQRTVETGSFKEEKTATFFTRRHRVPGNSKDRDKLSKGMRLDSGQ